MAYQKLQTTRAKVVTPSDTDNINYPASPDGLLESFVLYVGTSGDLRVLTASGDDVTFVGIIGGTFLPVQVIRVFSSGTSASSIIALW